MGWVVNATPRQLYLRERPGTHCIGGWMGPTAGLGECEKSRPHRDSIPGPRVAILTALFRPSHNIQDYYKRNRHFHNLRSSVEER
jgi:hypothetical protein